MSSRSGPKSEEPFVQEYLNILDDGYQPDLEEYLARVPEEHREPTRQRLLVVLGLRQPEADAQPDPLTPEQAAAVEPCVREYMNLLNEGWKPDLDEYLARVPEDVRELVRRELLSPDGTAAAVDPFVREYAGLLEQGWKHDLEKFLGRVPERLREAVRERVAGLKPRKDGEEAAPRIRSLADEIAARSPEPAPEPEAPAEPEPEPEAEVIELAGEPEPEAALEIVEEPEPEPLPEPETVAEPPAEEDAAEEEEEEPEDDAGHPKVSGYRIQAELGLGLLGRTFDAWDEINKRRVVLKLLRKGMPEKAPRRIVDESQRASAAGVPFDDVADGPAIVRGFVEGEPIDAAALGRPMKERAKLLEALAGRLALAHEAGLVHGSLKPGNVLVQGDEVTLVDFGLTAAPPSRTSLQDLPAETCSFASPERAQGRPPVAASDVFALGGVMYAALTGQPPFTGAAPLEVLRKIATEDPVFPRTLVPGIPEELEAICLSCLARNPRARPAAADVALELRRFLQGEPGQLRPARFRDLMRQQVREHVEHVEEWHGHGLLTTGERDRLEAVYRRALEREEHWTFDAQRITALQACLYAGIGLVVVAASLLQVFAAGPATVAVPALCVALLGAGVVARLRRDFGTAAAFVTGGILSAAPATLFALGAAGLLPEPQRLVAASGAALLLSGLSLALLRMSVFAWTTAATLVGCVLSALLLLGWAGLAPAEKATWLLPLALLLPIGLVFEKRGRFPWATPFYLVGFGAVVALPAVIAYYGTPFPLPGFLHGAWAAVALHALLLTGLQVGIERTKSLDLRGAARLLEVTAPVALLAGLYGNAYETREWAAVACFVAAAALLVVGSPWRRHRAWLMIGLVGLALACHLPVALALVPPATYAMGLAALGTVAVAGTMMFRRMRQR